VGNWLIVASLRDEGRPCDQIFGETSTEPLLLKCNSSTHQNSMLSPLHAVAFENLAGIDDVERLDCKRIVSGDTAQTKLVNPLPPVLVDVNYSQFRLCAGVTKMVNKPNVPKQPSWDGRQNTTNEINEIIPHL
jgi:hypothetical protein